MEHPREVEPGRELERHEAVPGDPEPGQGLVVGPRRERVRQHRHPRILGAQGGHHRVDQIAVERDLERDVPVHVLEAHVLSGELREGRERLVAQPGHVPHVDRRLGATGDHVRLVARTQLGRVGGVAHRRTHEPGRRPERRHEPGHARRVFGLERGARQVRDAREEVSNGRGEGERPLVLPDPRDGGGEVRDGVVGVDLAPVAGPAVRDEAQPVEPLLGGLQQVGALAADLDREAADLADRLGRTLEQVRTVVDRPSRPEDAARLLVREHRDDHVPRGTPPLPRHLSDDREDHRVHVLHVDRATAPEQPIALLPAERVDLPVARLGGNHVEVPMEHERVQGRILAGQSHDDVRPAGCRLVVLGVEPDLRE